MNEITDKQLDQKIQLLQQGSLELSPDRDLWPDIQASIQPEYSNNQGSRFERFYPLAAAAVLAVFIGSGLNQFSEDETIAPLGRELVAQYPVDVQDQGMLINAGYEQVRNVLVDDLLVRLETLSPEEITVIETNMAKIDAALAEINTALKSDPNNMLLQRLLMSAYSDDLALFGEINSMTRTLDERVQL